MDSRTVKRRCLRRLVVVEHTVAAHRHIHRAPFVLVEVVDTPCAPENRDLSYDLLTRASGPLVICWALWRAWPEGIEECLRSKIAPVTFALGLNDSMRPAGGIVVS